MDVYERLKTLGITLHPCTKSNGRFKKTKKFGTNLLYVSGCSPETPTRSIYGKLGSDVTLEDGKLAAADTFLNILSAIEYELKDLNRIVSFVKLLVFVSSSPDFYDQPSVANGATELLIDIFGEDIGCPSRSAIGVAVLPDNIAVETECIIEYK